MSKADELGSGRFGSAQGVSARRQAVAAVTGAATVGAPDSRLRTIPLEQLVPTRFNPRRNFGSDEDLLDFGLKLKKKQLQPAVAVTREAYLRLWKDEAGSVGTARYVIANGERRYRGSQAAGIGTLEVVVDDDVAKSRADFLDAVLSENNDREDLDPIERALGIQTMVEELGGKAKVAEHYGKSGGWVTQQMYLLNLSPELQVLVSSGDLPVRETRALVKLPHDEQIEAWRGRALEREAEKERPRVRHAPKKAPALPTVTRNSFTAVKNAPSPPQEPVQSPVLKPAPVPVAVPVAQGVQNPVLNEPNPLADEQELKLSPEAADVPEQRADPLVRPPVKMPWHDGAAAMEIIFRKLDEEQRRVAIGRYLEMVGDPEAAAADLKAAASPEYLQALFEHLSSTL
ncbi:ParB/RepB/Spo0J family partition protein [Streptomyces sp. NPDC057575]|uniref:ParB/RepB/Spo0J family partition protein n=1 Tax=unclassified Streptomyces TaxID=2593676 RepID=UPI0036AA6B3A